MSDIPPGIGFPRNTANVEVTQTRSTVNADHWLLVTILPAIIGGWILVSLWDRFIESFAYRTCGLNRNNTFHVGIVAIVTTLIFVTYLIFLESYGSDLTTQMTGVTVTSNIGTVQPV